jgi:hypothetical protein
MSRYNKNERLDNIREKIRQETRNFLHGGA